jgi:MFS family permease
MNKWVIVGLTVINQAVTVGITVYCFALFSIPWLETYAISRGELMLAIFAFQVMTGLISPVVGHIVDKIPLRMPMVTGIALFGCGLGILSLASAYWQVIAVYAVLFSASMVLGGTFLSQVLINRWFTADKGLALGISATGTSVGGMLFPPLIAWSLTLYSLASIFLYLALVCFFILIPLNAFVLRRNPPAAAEPGDTAEAGTSSPEWTTRTIIH